jgi:hypothetical protein
VHLASGTTAYGGGTGGRAREDPCSSTAIPNVCGDEMAGSDLERVTPIERP